MRVFSTIQEDSSAIMTISIGEDDHKFEVYCEDENALVEYQETLSWRGEVRVSKPNQKVYSMLMKSDKMTAFLEEYGMSGVQRADKPPGQNYHV
jgi:hypothetical protein